MAFLLLSLLCLLPVTDAYTTFDTNCTLPSGPEKINYISSPNTRGTLDILWSCLFTIVSCTWTVQYPEVPARRAEFEPGRKGWWKWAANKYSSQVGLFLLTLIAPEFLLGVYITQNTRLKACVKAFEDSGYVKLDGVEWTRSHIFLTEMGGLIMKISKRSPDSSDHSTQTEMPTTNDADGATSDLSLDTAKGLSDKVTPQQDTPTGEPDSAPEDLGTEFWTLDSARILALRKSGILRRLPDISKEEIQDRSKADGFVRVITVFQILWLCVQTIARAVEGLAITQLEIATVAFAICAVFMYTLCWHKPKGVEVPIMVFHYHGDSERIFEQFRKADAEPVQTDSRNWIAKSIDYSAEQFAGIMTLILGGFIFGGVHLLAWNFTFPTHTELVLWRAAALYCTCCLPASGFLLIFSVGFAKALSARGVISGDHAEDVDNYLGVGLTLLSGGVYILARMLIIVEMFRTLAFQPVEAFMGTWTVNIPYVS